MLSSLARGLLKDSSDKNFVKIDPVWGFAEFPPYGDSKKHTLPILIDPEAPTINPEDVTEKANDNKKSNSSQLKEYWMPDRYCKACYGCEEGFTMYRRRHHCRICGQVFCNTCSSFYIDGARFNTQSMVRCCKLCHNQFSKQTEKESRIGAKKNSDPVETHSKSPIFSGQIEVAHSKLPQGNEPSSLGAVPTTRQESSSNKNIQNRAYMHLTAIVDRLVTRSSILSGAEGSLTAWKDTIVSLVREVVSSVDPDVRGGDSLDIRPYVKIKIIPGGSRSDTIYIDGVVFRKNVSHKKMFGDGSRYQPRILLLSGGIEFHRTDTKLSSMDTLIEQEDKYMEILVEKIMSLRPEIILVGKAVARKAQELLCEHQIVVMQNVKPQLLERLSRMTGAMLLPSTDHMIQQFGEECLGTCQTFWLQVVQDDPERLSAEHPSRILKTRILRGSTYAYFQGCPAERGCSIRLRGENRTVLREIKRIIKFSIVVAYHLRLEVSYYCDRQAELPSSADSEDYDDCSDSDDGIYDIYDRERAPADSSSDEDSDDDQCDDDEGDAMKSECDKSEVGVVRKSKGADEPIPSVLMKRSERQFLSTSLDIDFKLPFSKELRGVDQQRATSLKKIAAKKLSVEDHQTLLITTVVMSECSGTNPVQKNIAEIKQIKYYTKQDIALGQFIVENCLQLNRIPRDPRILEQILSFIHRSGRIDITVQKISNDSQAQSNNDGQGAESPRSLPILMSSFCKDCKRVVTSPAAISEETWKISFGKFLEMTFYNRSARCKAGGCHHSLRDSHRLSFLCDGYKANFEFFPQHSFALHIRNGMRFPTDFHVEHTIMLMKNLPVKHSIVLDEFRMTLVGLEKKIREVLATRPEELKLAMSDIRIIENELHLNAILFLEDLLHVYNYLPATVRDIEYESKLESQLREKRLWSSSVITPSFSDSFDPSMIAKKEESSHPHRDSSGTTVDMRNTRAVSHSGDSDGEGDITNPHFEDIYNRPSTFFAMDFIKSSIPFSNTDHEDTAFRKSGDVDALTYRDGVYADGNIAKVAARFPMYLLCDTYFKASKWNNTIDSIDKYLESVIMHQQQQLQQQQQMSVATATLVPVGEDSIAMATTNAAIYNESDVHLAMKELSSTSDKVIDNDVDSAESTEVKASNNIDEISSDSAQTVQVELDDGTDSAVGEQTVAVKVKNDHISLAVAVTSAGSPARITPTSNNNGPTTGNQGAIATGADEVDASIGVAHNHAIAAVPEPLFLPNIIGMLSGESNPTNLPVPPMQYHSLSQALEYYRKTATEKPVDKMSRITKALKGFLGGLQKDAEEQSRFFVPLGDFGEGHLRLRPGRKGEIIQVHEDEYATIIAYTLASQEYHDTLQIHVRVENDSHSYNIDPEDIRDDQSVHRPSRSIEDTLVIFGDVATMEQDDFMRGFGGYRKNSMSRGKDASRSSSIDLPLNADSSDSRKLSPVAETKQEDDNDDDIDDNEIEGETMNDTVKKTDKKSSEISDLERAFAASGQHTLGMDAKDGNFSVFSRGNNNFSVFGQDFTDESDREALSNQDNVGSHENQHHVNDGRTGSVSMLSQSSAKLNISSSISKVIPSLSAISGRINTQTQNSTPQPTQTPSAPAQTEYSNVPGNRSSSARNIPKVDPANAGREKSPIEKQMISLNNRTIRHKFEDRDEKGNVVCKFQCYVYFAKQFEALRQCYFNEQDNENYIRSLSMSRMWTAQGGKSGATFSKTLDDRIVLKVVSPIELRMFNEFAPAYFEYMAKAYFHNLPTVLCKILGVYTVRYHNKESGKRVAENVLVMENIFYKRNITRTFDLKGSSRNRYIGVGSEQKLDTFDEALQKRRRERRRFLSNIEPSKRVAYFKVHKWQRKKKDIRHRMEAARRTEILQNLRTAFAESGEQDEAAGARNTGSADVEEFLNYESFFEPHQQLKTNQVLMDDNLIELTKGKPFPLKHRAKMFFHKAVLNDTLFLSFINVVDYSILVGFDETSHEIVVGIIDYLRQYDLVKKGERIVKSVGMFAGQAEPTIIQPSQYRKRFTSAMERYFMTVPDKWITHDS